MLVVNITILFIVPPLWYYIYNNETSNATIIVYDWSFMFIIQFTYSEAEFVISY